MKFNNRENECVKTEDGRTVWLSRSVAVVGLISAKVQNELYVLGCLRGDAVDNSGKMCLVCGYLDWDETGHEAVVRETWEEANLNLLNYGINPYPVYVNTNPKDDNLQNITLYYNVNIIQKTLPKVSNVNCAPGEIDNTFWIPIDEIDNYEWAFNHKNRIKELI